MERRLSTQDSNVEIINGVTYDVRIINGKKRLIEKAAVEPVYDVPQPAISYASPTPEIYARAEQPLQIDATSEQVQSASVSSLMAFIAELDYQIENVYKGDVLEAVQSQRDVAKAVLQAKQARNILSDMRGFRLSGRLNSDDIRQAVQANQPEHATSYDDDAFAVTKGTMNKLNDVLESGLSLEAYDRREAERMRIAEQQRLAAIIPSRPEVRLPLQPMHAPSGGVVNMNNEATTPSGGKEQKSANALNKNGWSKRRKLLGAAAVVAAFGGAVAGVLHPWSGEGDPSSDVAARADTVITQQDKEKMAPPMASKNFKVGLCINEAPLIQKGNVNGEAQAVPVFEGTDKAQHKIGTINADGSIDSIPVTIETAPVSLAACAPEAVRAALVTMKSGLVTFNRKDVTLQVLLGQGAPSMPSMEFKASPSKLLDEATAKTLQDTFNKDTTQQDLGTLAQSAIANAIVAKDSALVSSTEAYADAATKVNLQNQITDYYTALNQKVPEFKIELVGAYAGVVAVQPKGIDDIVKRNTHFEVTNGKVVKLSFPEIAQEGQK